MRSRGRDLARLLAALTILAQIAYPLVHGETRVSLTVVTVVLFFAASVTHAAVSRGPVWTSLFVLVTAGGGLLAEAVGVATGVPFGAYSYSPALGAEVLGVPAVIPLAWTMMAYPAYVVAGRLVRRGVLRIPVAAWALASWDVFLDPQMVDAGYWHWATPVHTLPGIPEVPAGNFLGWLVVCVVMMAVVEVALPRRRADRDAVPVTLYLWTYFSSVLAHAAFFGLPWSALWGGLAMGLVALPLIGRLRPGLLLARAPS